MTGNRSRLSPVYSMEALLCPGYKPNIYAEQLCPAVWLTSLNCVTACRQHQKTLDRRMAFSYEDYQEYNNFVSTLNTNNHFFKDWTVRYHLKMLALYLTNGFCILWFFFIHSHMYTLLKSHEITYVQPSCMTAKDKYFKRAWRSKWESLNCGLLEECVTSCEYPHCKWRIINMTLGEHSKISPKECFLVDIPSEND